MSEVRRTPRRQDLGQEPDGCRLDVHVHDPSASGRVSAQPSIEVPMRVIVLAVVLADLPRTGNCASLRSNTVSSMNTIRYALFRWSKNTGKQCSASAVSQT